MFFSTDVMSLPLVIMYSNPHTLNRSLCSCEYVNLDHFDIFLTQCLVSQTQYYYLYSDEYTLFTHSDLLVILFM